MLINRNDSWTEQEETINPYEKEYMNTMKRYINENQLQDLEKYLIND